MFENFKKAREIVENQEKLEQQEKLRQSWAKISSDPKDNLNELIRLSGEKGARFSINGNEKQFVIHSRPDYLQVILWIGIVIMSIVYLSFEAEGTGLYIIAFVYLAALLIYFKLAPTTYDITIDTMEKQMMLKCNNAVGRFLRPEIVIDFRHIVKLSGKEIGTKLKDGLNRWYNKIYVHHEGKKTPFIYLANGPVSKIDAEAFMLNLTNIIQPHEH